jgi:hypothetical protein
MHDVDGLKEDDKFYWFQTSSVVWQRVLEAERVKHLEGMVEQHLNSPISVLISYLRHRLTRLSEGSSGRHLRTLTKPPPNPSRHLPRTSSTTTGDISIWLDGFNAKTGPDALSHQ